MKVKVAYTTVIIKTVEVNDKFSVLSVEDPGHDCLDYIEQDKLMKELLNETANQAGCYLNDIIDVGDAETDEIFAEI